MHHTAQVQRKASLLSSFILELSGDVHHTMNLSCRPPIAFHGCIFIGTFIYLLFIWQKKKGDRDCRSFHFTSLSAYVDLPES